MTDEDKNQLLEAIFGGDELAGLRQASLSRGLNEMRRRRRRALAARVALMSVPVLLLAAMVLYAGFQTRHVANAPARMAFAPKSASKVEYITADQLFALFPNRPLALIGTPGHQQLVFLDEQPVKGKE